MTRVHLAIAMTENKDLWYEINLTFQVDQLSGINGLSQIMNVVWFLL
jgi:hypothetical protein